MDGVHIPGTYFQAGAPNSTSAGSPPQIPSGELTALPRPLAVFKGPTSKGRRGSGKGWEGRGKRKGEGWLSPPIGDSGSGSGGGEGREEGKEGSLGWGV